MSSSSTFCHTPFAICNVPPSPPPGTQSRRCSDSFLAADSPRNVSCGTVTPKSATTPTAAHAHPRRCALKLLPPTSSPPLSLGSSPISNKGPSSLLGSCEGIFAPTAQTMTTSGHLHQDSNDGVGMQFPSTRGSSTIEVTNGPIPSLFTVCGGPSQTVSAADAKRKVSELPKLSPSAMYSNQSASLAMLLSGSAAKHTVGVSTDKLKSNTITSNDIEPSSPLGTTQIFASPSQSPQSSTSDSEYKSRINYPSASNSNSRPHMLLGTALLSPPDRSPTADGNNLAYPKFNPQPIKVISSRSKPHALTSPPSESNHKGANAMLSPPMLNNNELANLLGGYTSGRSSAIVSPEIAAKSECEGQAMTGRTRAAKLLPNDLEEVAPTSFSWPPPLSQTYGNQTNVASVSTPPSIQHLSADGFCLSSQIPLPSPPTVIRHPSRAALKLKSSPSSMPMSTRHESPNSNGETSSQAATIIATSSALLSRPSTTAMNSSSSYATPRQLTAYEKDSIIRLKVLVSESYRYQRQLLLRRFDSHVASIRCASVGRGPSPQCCTPITHGFSLSDLSFSVSPGNEASPANQLFHLLLNRSCNQITGPNSPCTNCEPFETPRLKSGCCSDTINNESTATNTNENLLGKQIPSTRQRQVLSAVEAEAIARLEKELATQLSKLREEYVSLRNQIDIWWADEVKLIEKGELSYKPSLSSPPTTKFGSGAFGQNQQSQKTSPPRDLLSSSPDCSGIPATASIFGGLGNNNTTNSAPCFFLTKTSIDSIYEKIRQKFTPMLLWDDLDVLAIEAEAAADKVAKARLKILEQQRSSQSSKATWPQIIPATSPAATAAPLLSIDTAACDGSLNENIVDPYEYDRLTIPEAFRPMLQQQRPLSSLLQPPSAPGPPNQATQRLSPAAERYRRVLGTPPYTLLAFMDKVHEQRMMSYYETEERCQQ